MKLTARTIINGKYWIAEGKDGKVGTVRMVSADTYEFVNEGQTSTLTEQEFNKQFSIKHVEREERELVAVYGYPTNVTEAYNQEVDEGLNVATYTKTPTGKTKYSPGYYGLLFPRLGWTASFCPKFSTLQSYEFVGPYKLESDMKIALKNKQRS